MSFEGYNYFIQAHAPTLRQYDYQRDERVAIQGWRAGYAYRSLVGPAAQEALADTGTLLNFNLEHQREPHAEWHAEPRGWCPELNPGDPRAQ